MDKLEIDDVSEVIQKYVKAVLENAATPIRYFVAVHDDVTNRTVMTSNISPPYALPDVLEATAHQLRGQNSNMRRQD